MKQLYTLAIRIYVLGIRLAALFKPKAALWINGRKQWKAQLATLNCGDAPLVWFHCASLGEFEQARPVIEALKKERPDCFLLLTFFSPSGYEIRKNYSLADMVMYLPADTPENASEFIRLSKPALLVLVKYEFWFNYLNISQQRNIPVMLIAGRFHPNQLFFKPWGKWAVEILKRFSVIHAQEETDLELLRGIQINNVVLSGDPRYDRTVQNAESVSELPEIRRWIGDRKCWVAGSTWLEDELLLFPWDNNHALIIAPHEVNEDRIQSIERSAKASSLRYSQLMKQPDGFSSVLIIDNIGMLMRIYALADAAWVGGAFRTGLHNILEPAAFGIPVYFGPQHNKFPEAAALIKAGGGFSLINKGPLLQAIAETGSVKMKEAGAKAGKFVRSRKGATARILPDILKLIAHV